TGYLKYAYSNTPDGSSGWSSITVDSTGDVGWYSSLAEVNGHPAVSYLDYTNYGLKYAHSTTLDGSSGWSTLVVYNTYSIAPSTSLKVVNGHPAISYID